MKIKKLTMYGVVAVFCASTVLATEYFFDNTSSIIGWSHIGHGEATDGPVTGPYVPIEDLTELIFQDTSNRPGGTWKLSFMRITGSTPTLILDEDASWGGRFQVEGEDVTSFSFNADAYLSQYMAVHVLDDAGAILASAIATETGYVEAEISASGFVSSYIDIVYANIAPWETIIWPGGWSVRVVDVNVTTQTHIPVLPDPASIVDWSISNNVMRLEINAPGPSISYYPEAASDLGADPWGSVPHSEKAEGPFVVTNLGYSSAEGTNEVIFVETTSPVEFFKIIGTEL